MDGWPKQNATKKVDRKDIGLEKSINNVEASYPKKPSILERIDHVTWAAFTLPMATGGIALLLSVQPHGFTGLLTIGKVVYIIDLCIFTLLVSLISTRFIRNPAKLKLSLTHPTESLFFPALFLSMPSIIGGMQQYGVSSTGEWLITTLRVLFWIYAAVTFLVAVIQYYILFTGEHLTVQDMTPAWLMPVFPVMLTGTLASIIAGDQPDVYRLSILVCGATFQGLGFWSAISIYSIYMHRLIRYGLPAPNVRPGMFISVGPPSFTGLALIGMSQSIPHGYAYFEVHPTAINALQQIALAFAIFIWSLGLWFFGISLLSCIMGFKKMTFHMVWWALVFPNTGFIIALIQIGNGLHSSAILWVGSVLSVVIIMLYLIILAANIRAIWHGQIWYPGKDEDKNE